MGYDYNNPCLCSDLIPGGSSSPSCNGECIYAPQMLLIKDDETIAPCGETKTILWDKCMDTCSCEKNGDTVTYEVHSEHNLKINSIDENGMEVESDAANTDETFGKVEFIVRCGNLSTMGSLIVVFKKLCLNKNCDAGYECDKCTGDCVSQGADLDVT